MLHPRSDGPRGPKELRKGLGFSAKDLKAAAVQSLQCLERKVPVKQLGHRLLPLWLPRLGSNWRLVSKFMSYPLLTAFPMHLLLPVSPFSFVSKDNSNSDTSLLVSKALLSRIEYLEAENKSLRRKSQTVENAPFCVECIANDDKLIKLYTEFYTHSVFVAFLAFLVPLLMS